MGRGLVFLLTAILLFAATGTRRAVADEYALPVALTAAVATAEGVLAGTDDGWLLRCDLDGRRVTAQALPEGGAVRDLALLGGRAYALTEHGLLAVPDSGPPVWTLGPWPAGADEEMQSLAAAEHCLVAGRELYLHSFHDIYRCDPATGATERLIRTPENISAVAVIDATVWFGTLRGLYRWQPGMTEAEAVSPSQFGLLVPLVVTTAATAGEVTMVGTLGAGLLVRDAAGSWRADGSEPEIFRVYPAGGNGAIIQLPASRWRSWSADGGWGDTVELPFGAETRILAGAAVLTVFEPGGNGIQRLRAGQWEQYFAGREQLFYRGRGGAAALAPAASAAMSAKRRWLLLLLLVPVAAIMSLLWRRRKEPAAAAGPAPVPDDLAMWQETPPALPSLIPVSAYREQLRPVWQGLEQLAAEQQRIEKERAALPAAEQDAPAAQEKFRRQLRELKQQVDERHARAREIAGRLRAEIAGLQRELQAVQSDRARLELDFHDRKIDRSEARAWRKRLLLRQAGAEWERAARQALAERFADVLPE